MRLFALPLLLLGLNVCMAQTPARSPAAEPSTSGAARTDTRAEPRIERIHHEDAGSRIDELRVGGETRQITVQPKGGMPAYELAPDAGTRPAGTVDREGTPSTRGWKLLGF